MLGEEVAVCLLPLLGSRNGLEFSAILNGNKNWEICGDILDYINRDYSFKYSLHELENLGLMHVC